MLASLLFWLLAFSGVVARQVESDAGDPPSTQAPRFIDCFDCKGRGAQRTACWLCEEDRKLPCHGCQPGVRPTRPKSGPTPWIPKAIVTVFQASLKDAMKDFDKDMSALGKKAGLRSLGKSSRKRKVVDKGGSLRCPTSCKQGERGLRNGPRRFPCSLCKKGRIRCGVCAGKGSIRCPACEGRGKADETCSTCDGGGRLELVAAEAIDRCPWCDGTEKRPCGRCADDHREPFLCLTCFGVVKVLCTTCSGAANLVCPSCEGVGKSADGKRCRPCKSRGKVDCMVCHEGVVGCPEEPHLGVAGGPPERVACFVCSGSRVHGCGGCFEGQYHAWEATARAFELAGDPASANAWYREAISRCETLFGVVAKWSPQGPGALQDPALLALFDKELEKERKQELRRLEKGIRKVPARTD